MRFATTIFVFFTFFVGFFVANAEETVPQPVNVRLLFLDESGSSYFVLHDDAFRKISSYPYAISSPIPLPPEQRLDIYKEIPRPPNAEVTVNEHGEELPYRIRIATVRVSAQSTNVLAVLWPGKENESYSVTYYNHAPELFPSSSLRVLNLARVPVAVEVGGKLERIEPGRAGVIQAEPDSKYRLIVRVAVQKEVEWKLLYDSVVMMRPGERVTGVLVYSPSGMRHTYTAAELLEFGDPPPRHQWLMYTEKIEETE